MRKLIYALLALVTITLVAIFLFIQNANRFKPELESLIADQTGVPIKISGELGWRLYPPLLLTAEHLTAEYEGRRWQLGRLALDIDVLTLLGDLDHWKVQSLTIDNLTMVDGEDIIEIQQGICNLAAELNGATYADLEYEKKAKDAKDELIPVASFHEYNWQGTCALDELTLQDHTFEKVTIDLKNDNALSITNITVPDFFGGSAKMSVTIDATTTPVAWTVTPTLTNVDSQRLMQWLDQRLQWVALLTYGGTLHMTGNTDEELAASISGETVFDGGQGLINIARIKQQLLRIAVLLNETDKITVLPDMWPYERFVGNWRIEAQHHQLDFALDNLTVLAEGDYEPLSDQLDILAELTFENDPDLPVFDINPVLLNLTIPVRCRGPLADPTCRIDDRAAQRVVASALSKSDSPLRAKIEEKIEEKVPEEYQDAAKALLDLLSGSRRKED